MNKSFGKFLKECRENKKLTQKELAKTLFVSAGLKLPSLANAKLVTSINAKTNAVIFTI